MPYQLAYERQVIEAGRNAYRENTYLIPDDMPSALLITRALDQWEKEGWTLVTIVPPTESTEPLFYLHKPVEATQ